jgi:hypothetical protein
VWFFRRRLGGVLRTKALTLQHQTEALNTPEVEGVGCAVQDMHWGRVLGYG